MIELKKPDNYWGECKAFVNEEEWIACPYAKLKVEDDIKVLSIKGIVFNESFLIRESISIINVPLELGTYQLDDWRSEERPFILFVYKDHDVALADYLVQEGVEAKGTVSLTEYDEILQEIKGTFECTLYLYQNPGKPDAPDSLVITDGYFHTRIVD
ncbi:MAG TPA: hypothetical protein VI603_08020 [Saprospiraceae bacterium]|nr:hypothetical protein [Saprospiraceae bacterium]